MTTFDAVVVGGGPAGLTAAIAAQQSGMKVLVLDRRRPPIDKACGEGVMPGGVAALQSLGIQLPAAETIRSFRFCRNTYQCNGTIRWAI